MASPDEIQCLVFDSGSGRMLANFAGEDAPKVVFPSVIGRPRRGVKPQGDEALKHFYVGNDAIANLDKLDLKVRLIVQFVSPIIRCWLQYPMEHGLVTSWDDMEKIWRHTYANELRVSAGDHPVLMSDRHFTPKSQREKITQIMFETFRVPGFQLADSGLLGMYASGRTDAVIVDCGDGVTSVVPVWEAHCPEHSVQRLNYGGRDITRHLASMLNDLGHSFKTTADLETVRQIKEKLCYVSTNFEEDIRTAHETTTLHKQFEHPDHKTITLGSERFRCTEVMFNHSLAVDAKNQRIQTPESAAIDAGTMMKLPFGVRRIISDYLGSRGLQHAVFECIMRCPIDIRRDLFRNIVLSGGTTMFEGFGERLQQEIKALHPAPRNIGVRVVSYPERKYSVWIGGSIIASLSTFQPHWIKKQEYEEAGPQIIHRRGILLGQFDLHTLRVPTATPWT